jgi:exodeoxyribonuclease VII small subunit
MAKNETRPIETLSYEDAYKELEAIVADLESGEQPLEEALSLFERGQKLSRQCASLLAQADLRVQELAGETVKPMEQPE